ncbi:MAG: sulfurtransferase TusA family protein [Dehalococcoidia bacterium]|nr:sulfurtransferase TusA family protein [Dehalococcoidia bacterium]
MSVVIDCRGLACPEPVVRTNKALEQADEVTAIVDNEIARENVSRLAKSKGFGVEIESKDGLFYMHLKRESALAEEIPCQLVSCHVMIDG